jgi:hypothetical protein
LTAHIAKVGDKTIEETIEECPEKLGKDNAEDRDEMHKVA